MVIGFMCVSVPNQGSRVVFMSFMDYSSQIEKFAVRFPTCTDAETFLNSVKECSRDTMNIGPPGSDLLCENSSPSEVIASNRLYYRYDEESSHEEPIAISGPKMPALTYDDGHPDGPLQPLLANDIDSIFSGFPPSFTELLNNCSNDTEKGNASDQPQLMEEAELKSQIAKYMSDNFFHEMLFKVEQAIDEVGGNLAV